MLCHWKMEGRKLIRLFIVSIAIISLLFYHEQCIYKVDWGRENWEFVEQVDFFIK